MHPKAHTMQNLFPRDRFLSVDLIKIAQSSESDCTDDENEIEIELDLGHNSTLTLCFPSQHLGIEKIPIQILEILSQLNHIDNIVQCSCENSANASSMPLNNHQHIPSIIYLEHNGTIFIDYWGINVNNQWSVYLGKRDDTWIPFKDSELNQQL
jgi:hypothetical protein